MRPPRALSLLRLAVPILITLFKNTNSLPQTHVVCKQPNTQTCFIWFVKLEDINNNIEEIKSKTYIPDYCGISNLQYFSSHRKAHKLKLSPLDDTIAIKTIYCKRIVIEGPANEWRDIARILGSAIRVRREGFAPRGRYRGQTQSQYLAIDGGNGKDEGKAEAHSAADSSRASVSGNSGMGQAQSQSVFDSTCDDCLGKSDHEVENLKRPNGPSEGAMSFTPGGENAWPTSKQQARGPTYRDPNSYQTGQLPGPGYNTATSNKPGSFGGNGYSPIANNRNKDFISTGTPTDYRPTGGVSGGRYIPTRTTGIDNYRPNGVTGGSGYSPAGTNMDVPAGTTNGRVYSPTGTVGGVGYNPTGIPGGGGYSPTGTKEENGYSPTGTIGGGYSPNGASNGGYGPSGSTGRRVSGPTATTGGVGYGPTATIGGGDYIPTGNTGIGRYSPSGTMDAGRYSPAGTPAGGSYGPIGTTGGGSYNPSENQAGSGHSPYGNTDGGIYSPTGTTGSGGIKPSGTVDYGSRYRPTTTTGNGRYSPTGHADEGSYNPITSGTGGYSPTATKEGDHDIPNRLGGTGIGDYNPRGTAESGGYKPSSVSTNYRPSGTGQDTGYGPRGNVGIQTPGGQRQEFGERGQLGVPGVNWPTASGPYPGPGGSSYYCCVIPNNSPAENIYPKTYTPTGGIPTTPDGKPLTSTSYDNSEVPNNLMTPQRPQVGSIGPYGINQNQPTGIYSSGNGLDTPKTQMEDSFIGRPNNRFGQGTNVGNGLEGQYAGTNVPGSLYGGKPGMPEGQMGTDLSGKPYISKGAQGPSVGTIPTVGYQPYGGGPGRHYEVDANNMGSPGGLYKTTGGPISSGGQYGPGPSEDHYGTGPTGGSLTPGGQYGTGPSGGSFTPGDQYQTGPSRRPTSSGESYRPGPTGGAIVPGGQYGSGPTGGPITPGGQYATGPTGTPTIPGGKYGTGPTGGTMSPGGQYGTGPVGGTVTPGGQYGTGPTGDSRTPGGHYGTGPAEGTITPGGQYGSDPTGGTIIPGGQYGPGSVGGTMTPGGQYGTGPTGGTRTPGGQYGTGPAEGTMSPGGQHGTGPIGGTMTPGGQYGTGHVEGPVTPGGQYGTGPTGGTRTPGGQYGTGPVEGTMTPGGQYGSGPTGGTRTPGGQYGMGPVEGTMTPGGQYGTGPTGGIMTPGGQYETGPTGETMTPGGQYGTVPTGGNMAPGGQYGRDPYGINGMAGPNIPQGQYGKDAAGKPYDTGIAREPGEIYGGSSIAGPNGLPTTGSSDVYSNIQNPNSYGRGVNGQGIQREPDSGRTNISPDGVQGGQSSNGHFGNIPEYYNQGVPKGQTNDYNGGPPLNYVDPNSIIADGDDSEAEASIGQTVNGTIASASSKGGNDKGRAQTNVHGTYTGTGSFQAQAQITGENKEAQSEVSGGKKGASSSASGSGRNNKSQANVQLGSETGSVQTQSQSNGVMHSSNSQVQGSLKGGMADAQARGPGSTSSQAQIGFTPYKDQDKASHDAQVIPFTGGGVASAQSSGRTGQSQSQLHGTFKYGITYNGAAQSGASLDKDTVFPNRLSFDKIDVFDENEKNINVDVSERTQSNDIDIPKSLPSLQDLNMTESKNTIEDTTTDTETDNETDNLTNNETDETMKNSESRYSSHTHLDHHKTNSYLSHDTSNAPSVVGNRRFLYTNYANNADYELTTDKEENPSENYDTDGGFDNDSTDAADVEQSEYANYDEVTRDSPSHESYRSSNRKRLDVQQTTGGSTQHIVLGSLKDHNAEITQKNSERPDEAKVYQPGERVPGTGGYTIPIGFTGSVKSVASKDKTYVVGSKDSPSQAQTVTLTPGTGKIKYKYPASYAKYVKPKNLRSLQTPKENDNRYVSVSKSVTRALDGENNVRKQYSHTYFTKSSSCGYFTFTCTMVSSAEGRKKVCKPKIPTNPDGTPIKC